MAQSADEVSRLLTGHFRWVDEMRPEWASFAAAHKGRFWDKGRHPWAGIGGDNLPVKVQVNALAKFIRSFTANLFYRAPRTEALLPRISAASAGRPRKLQADAAVAVSLVADDLLGRDDVQGVAKNAYRIALMYGLAGLKLGLREGSGPATSRSWMDVIPPWELVYDDRSRTWEGQRYKAHVRWEPLEVARLLLEDPLDDVKGVRLPDWLDALRLDNESDERHRDESYVLIAEWYDLTELKVKDQRQRWFLLDMGSDVNGRTCSAKEYTQAAKPIPYTSAAGRAAVPLEPVVLTSDPEFPLRGIPTVRDLYAKVAEKNLLLSIVANMMRRDGARHTMVSEDVLDEKMREVLAAAVDGEAIPIKSGGKPLDQIAREFPMPRSGENLDRYYAWLEQARQDESVQTDIAGGRQGKYLSATEAQLLSEYSESTTGEIAKEMDGAIGRLLVTYVVMMGAEQREPLRVRVDASKTVTIRPETLQEPWQLKVIDNASSPVREAQRRQELLTIQGPMIELATLAAGGPPQPDPDGPEGPAKAEPAVPVQVQVMAQRMLDHMVQLWNLPPSLSWTGITMSIPEEKDDPEDDGKIEELMERARGIVQGQGPQAGPPQPPLPPGPPGMPQE